MGFFDTIGNKVMSAGNQLSSRAKDTGEQMRLTNENQNLSRQLALFYQQAGEMYYNQQRGNVQVSDVDFESVFNGIDRIKEHIRDNEKRIEQLKSQISCPSCGRMIPFDTKFCPYCGVPVNSEENRSVQSIRAEEVHDTRAIEVNGEIYEQEKLQPQTADSDQPVRFCPHCGATVETGMKFCTSCGRPIESPDVPQTQQKNIPDSEEASQTPSETPDFAQENQDIVPADTGEQEIADVPKEHESTQEERP